MNHPAARVTVLTILLVFLIFPNNVPISSGKSLFSKTIGMQLLITIHMIITALECYSCRTNKPDDDPCLDPTKPSGKVKKSLCKDPKSTCMKQTLKIEHAGAEMNSEMVRCCALQPSGWSASCEKRDRPLFCEDEANNNGSFRKRAGGARQAHIIRSCFCSNKDLCNNARGFESGKSKAHSSLLGRGNLLFFLLHCSLIASYGL